MTYGITPKTWDGIDIDTDDYMAQFVEDSQSLDNTPAQAVRSTRPGLTPVHSYVQPAEKKYVLEVIILGTMTQAKYDTVAGWFDTIAGADHVLVVTDGDSNDRRISCVVEGFTVSGIGNNVFKVNLSSDDAIQLSDTAADDTPILLDSPSDTFSLDNDGNTGAPLVLAISPEAHINADDGYSKAKRIWLANKSEQPLTHFAAEGYAIEITDGGIDTPALDVNGDLSDLRVWLNGRELERWLNVTSPNVSTKIWCNIAMRPGRFATLAADISNSDTVLTISGVNTFEGWDRQGWMFIGSEPCVYSIADDLTATISRSAGVSHSAGAAITFCEHILTLTYGFNNSGQPDAGDDSKPVIDLDASSNVEHHWPGPFYNDNDQRSMTWRRVVEGDGSPNIRGYDDGDNMVFEDLLPETGKPLADTVEVRFPVPCVGPVELDRDVANGLLLQGYAADLDGFESLLIEKLIGDVADDSYSLANEMTRLRLKVSVASVVGTLDTASISGAYPFDSGTVGLGVTDYNQGDADHPINLFANIHTAVAFTLGQDTYIDGFAARFGASGTVQYSLRTADLSRNYGYGFFTATANEISYSGSAFGSLAPIGILPAGDYLMIFNFTAGQSIAYEAQAQTHVSLATTLLPEDVPVGGGVAVDGLYTNGLHLITVADEDFPAPAQPVNVGAPVWSLLSTKTPPQDTATVHTGFTVTIDNVIAPLDDTRSPLILVGSEFDLFPIFGTLTNNETGDSMSLSFLCMAGEEVELDFAEGSVTDKETGLEASYAVDYSNPTRRLYLAKGSNEFQIAIAGVSSSAKLDVTPTYRHAWL